MSNTGYFGGRYRHKTLTNGLRWFEPSYGDGVVDPSIPDLPLEHPAATGGATEGAINVTLDAASLSATGDLLVNSSLSTTLDAATLAATGALPIAGSLGTTLGDVTLASTGTLPITGSLSATLADATLTANGSSLAANNGEVTTTLDDVTLASTATIADAPASFQQPGGFIPRRPRPIIYVKSEPEEDDEQQDVSHETPQPRRIDARPVINRIVAEGVSRDLVQEAARVRAALESQAEDARLMLAAERSRREVERELKRQIKAIIAEIEQDDEDALFLLTLAA